MRTILSWSLALVVIVVTVAFAAAPKITTDEHAVTIQDLGSTNGTFVNGEKVRKADLKDGDRILIGTSIIKIVYVEGESTSSMSETEARSKMAVAANRRTAAPKSMAGSIEEIPLPRGAQIGAIVRGLVTQRDEQGLALGDKRGDAKPEVIIAHHDTVVQTGDRVIVFMPSRKQVREVERLFQVAATFF